MANESIKVLELAAFQLEAGLTGAGQSPGWGETGSEEALGANDGFPYINLGKGLTINHVEDQSITSEAFKDVSRQVCQYVEKGIVTYPRFAGLGSFNYWMWGFENPVLKVFAAVLSTPSVEPTAGATYKDTDLNDFTFLRMETWGSTIYHVFSCDDDVAPTLQTGDLDKQAGTGDAALTMTAHSGLKYEHLYELDAHERHMVAYRTAEQVTGYTAGDLKNRMATIGIKMGTNDYRYRNSMCKGFKFSSSSGALTELATDFIAYDEGRADYSSASWTIPSDLQVSDNIIAHHDMLVQVGVDEDNLVDLGVSGIDMGVEIPLQVLQDTGSGLYLAEPVIEGKYAVSCALTLSRHTVETYQAYRDAWTSVVARVASRSGYDMQEYLIQEAKCVGAGPDDSEVAKENLELVPGYTHGTDNWSTWLTGNTLIQDGPILLRVRDDDSTNHMFEI